MLDSSSLISECSKNMTMDFFQYFVVTFTENIFILQFLKLDYEEIPAKRRLPVI